MDTRIDKIYAYAHKKEEEKKKKQEQLNNKRAELLKKIQYLNLEVADLIGTATACLNAGIEIDKYSRCGSRTFDTYEKGTFVANGISHRLGFIAGKNAVLGIGIRCIGTNCDFDLISEDYGNVYARSAKYREKVDISNIPIPCLEYFLCEFGNFRDSFYRFVDEFLSINNIE